MDINKDGLTSEEEYFHQQQVEQLAKLREVAAIESAEAALKAAKEGSTSTNVASVVQT